MAKSDARLPLLLDKDNVAESKRDDFRQQITKKDLLRVETNMFFATFENATLEKAFMVHDFRKLSVSLSAFAGQPS